MGGVRPGNTPLNRGSPFCFPVFPAGNRPKIEVVSRYFPKNFLKNFPQIVSRSFPIGLQWPLLKINIVSRCFPKKNRKKSPPQNRFPIFPRKIFLRNRFPVFPDRFTVTPFKNPYRFPVFPDFCRPRHTFSFSFFLPKSFPDFSREIPPVLASFVFLSRYFPREM